MIDGSKEGVDEGKNLAPSGVALALAVVASQPAMARECADIARAAPADAEITAATLQPAGPFKIPPELGPATTVQLPAFCRVQGVLHPTRGSAYRLRGLAAGRELERPLSRGRQRRIRRFDPLFRPRGGGAQRATPPRRTDTGHRAGGTDAQLGRGASGEGHRFRLAGGAPDRRRRQGVDGRRSTARRRATPTSLVLERRPAGPDGGAAVPRRL